MGLSYAEIVDVVSLVIYSPSFLLALLLCFKHGFSHSEGWILLVTFTALRIAGDSIFIYAANTPHPSVSLVTAGAILSSVGLSPLLLATIGCLLRIDRICRQRFTCSPSIRNLLLGMYLPIMIATILGIVGGVHAGNAVGTTGAFTPDAVFKAAAILFLLSWVGLAALAVAVFLRRHAGWIPWREELLMAAVMAALPLLLVRLIYLTLVAFVDSASFNLLAPDETIQLCMATLEEYIIVIMYLLCGALLQKLPRDTQRPRQRPHSSKMNDFDAGRASSGELEAGAYAAPPPPPPPQYPQQTRSSREHMVAAGPRRGRSGAGPSMQTQTQTQAQGAGESAWVRAARYTPIVHWFVPERRR